jgi:hypothetical protein
MAVNNKPLGASGTTLNDMGNMGALTPILGRLAGGSKGGQMAADFARQMYPDPPKADPYEAALQFFLAMGQGASQPGATVLGSAVGAMQAPADYLAAKKKEKRETDQARMQTALQLAPSLKPAAKGKADYIQAVIDGQAGLYTSAEISKAKTEGKVVSIYEKPSTGGKTYKNVTIDGVPTMATDTEIAAAKAAGKKITPYQAPSQGSEDKIRMNVVLKGVADDTTTPIDERITSILRDDFDSEKHIPIDALPKDSSSSEDNVLIDVIDRTITDNPLTRENEQIKTIKRGEFDSEKHVQVGAVEGETLNLEEIVKAERELRNEYVKRSDDFKEAKRNYATIKVSEEQANGPGDVALITSFMKMLDPGSVVRETEFANARDTAGLLETLGNALQKAQTGEFLNPTQRAEFTALAEQYLYAAQNQQLKVRQSLGLTVQSYGLTASNVFGVEVAPASAYLNSELIDMAIETNQTVDKLWSVMSEEERRQYGG